MRNAIIYLTHHATEHDDIQLSRLTDAWNAEKSENDIYVVLDVTNIPDDADKTFHVKNRTKDKNANLNLIKLTEDEVTSHLKELNYVIEYYGTQNNTLFQYNCMLVIMYVWLYLLKNKGYDYVWIAEYDVYFKGNWSYLFDFFSNKDEDYIPAQINPYSLEFWHARQYNFKEDIPMSEFLVSFNPIMRLSRKAFDTLDASYRNGSSGFYEIFIATLFNHLGLKQRDLCSFGFTDRLRFYYIKHGSLNPSLMNIDNYLYHPVKNVLNVK